MLHTGFSLKLRELYCHGDQWAVYELQDGDRYQLTKAELDWLDFVRGRYAIADHFDDNIEDGIYTVDTIGLSEALWMDDCRHYPACLDDETPLALIVYFTADTSTHARISSIKNISSLLDNGY